MCVCERESGKHDEQSSVRVGCVQPITAKEDKGQNERKRKFVANGQHPLAIVSPKTTTEKRPLIKRMIRNIRRKTTRGIPGKKSLFPCCLHFKQKRKKKRIVYIGKDRNIFKGLQVAKWLHLRLLRKKNQSRRSYPRSARLPSEMQERALERPVRPGHQTWSKARSYSCRIE